MKSSYILSDLSRIQIEKKVMPTQSVGVFLCSQTDNRFGFTTSIVITGTNHAVRPQ